MVFGPPGIFSHLGALMVNPMVSWDSKGTPPHEIAGLIKGRP